jgi:hypothetical protein
MLTLARRLPLFGRVPCGRALTRRHAEASNEKDFVMLAVCCGLRPRRVWLRAAVAATSVHMGHSVVAEKSEAMLREALRGTVFSGGARTYLNPSRGYGYGGWGHGYGVWGYRG